MSEPYDFENRFRDPAFVAVWDRWQKARAAWDKAGRDLPFACFTEEHNVYCPDPERMPDAGSKAAAQEFLDARTAYKSLTAELIARDPTL